MNLKYQFYKGYYNTFDPRIFQEEQPKKEVADYNAGTFREKNNIMLGYQPTCTELDALKITKDQFGEQLRQFILETAYPGLVSGTGYTHETGNTGEFKIGFHFDHTTGLPYLPGHSIKGAIRNAFPRYEQPRTSEDKQIKDAKASYILQLLGLESKVPAGKQCDWVHRLEKHLFEAYFPESVSGSTEHKRQQDIFLDARICKAGASGCIVGMDAITPHGDKIWKNPIPLPFLKVLPGVSWEFSFLLHPVKLDGIDICSDTKCGLFLDILQEQGLGAKTNVGYGQFKSLPSNPFKS